MFTSRRLGMVALAVALLLAAACAPSTPEPGIVQQPLIYITPGPMETILISQEEIPQNNCDGGAVTSQTVERSYTVSRILELGTALTVDAGGRAGIPGVGEVGVGAAVASHYNVSYGSEETVTRSVTVAAEKGANILHTVRQNMLWETGTLVVAGAAQPILYRFRKDFSMETLPPANIGCPGQGVQPPQPTTPADSATVVQPTAEPENQSAQPDCPFLTNSHIEQLRAAASVSDALQQAEDFAGHQQNDYSEGSIIPVGVIIAIDLQSADLSLFPVSPIKNQGGWGLFVTTDAFTAPDAGTYWCIR